jgi:hypothetical protein
MDKHSRSALGLSWQQVSERGSRVVPEAWSVLKVFFKKFYDLSLFLESQEREALVGFVKKQDLLLSN